MSPTQKTAQVRARGGCLCGAVRYEVHGPLRPVVTCHCEMCRRTSGHHVAASACRREDLQLHDKASALRWFRSSPGAHRGFCSVCGSNLFWEPATGSHVSIMAGTLDRPTGLSIAAHIYADEADDYYRICNDAPRFTDGEHGVDVPRE